MFFWDVNTPYSETPKEIPLNYWGENFTPLEDLYPPDAFMYDPVWDLGKSGGKSGGTPNEDEILYQTALTCFAEEDYPNAEATFKDLIETYPQSHFAIAALHELFALPLFTNHDYATLHNYYASFTPSDNALYNTADFFATRCHVMERNWQPAVDWYEYRIENPPSYQDSVFAVIDLGDIHLMMERDTLGTKSGTATYRLAEMKPGSKQEYEEHKTRLLATLPQIKKPQANKPQVINKTGALGQNIPNPATGTTTIGFEIYREGAVEIRIYNISGQPMQILPQGTLTEGNYQITVSLANIPDGVYSYVLFVNGKKTDAKMMVVN